MNTDHIEHEVCKAIELSAQNGGTAVEISYAAEPMVHQMLLDRCTGRISEVFWGKIKGHPWTVKVV